MNRLLDRTLQRARESAFWLFVLNRLLQLAIPFNRPHRITIISLTEFSVRVKLPYRRSNLNHVGGLHACSLATAAEFATGILLLSVLKAEHFRILMRQMRLEYFFQGRDDAVVEFTIDPGAIDTQVRTPLDEQDAVLVQLETKVFDVRGNHLCTALVEWQIKHWRAVTIK